MLSNWRVSNWGDEISLEYGKALRGYSPISGKFRVFGSNGPIGWTSQALTHGPGVILGRKGAYRGVEYWRDPFWVIDTAYYIVPKSDLDMRWLYYAVKHHKLGEIDDGSPIPSTTRAAVYIKDVDIPPLPEQRAIAHILGSLDDKIELNRKRNETLEAMARALFQDWFVDFGPVRAKMEGRAPYLPAEIWELFPEKLDVDGKPEWWKMGEIQVCCMKIQNGGTPRRNEPRFWEGGNIPWLTSGEVRQPIITTTLNFITQDGLEKSSAKWVSEKATVIALYGATAGQVSYVSSPLTTNQAVCALIPKNGYAHFNYLAMRETIRELENKAVGSAQQNISKGIVEQTSVILPPDKLVQIFDHKVIPFFENWISNLRESQILAQLRDTVLPKLISGKIQIDNIDKFSDYNSLQEYNKK
jgi:type I restriction enzyme, S subunit